ncbi:MAG: MltA domain-containing protein [Burkholderiaceae bacterium]
MRRAYRAKGAAASALAGVLLAACSAVSLQGPAPVEPRAPRPATPSATPSLRAEPAPSLHPLSRWQPADWSELPGWDSDRSRDAWIALQRSCARLPAELQREAPAWPRVCAEALRHEPADDAATRAWLAARFLPYRVLALEAQASGDGMAGLATGYFEPQIDASRTPRGAMRVPLHAPPADLATRKPWYTRAQAESLPAARAALRGREIAFVADPLDVLLLQVQGSGRLRLIDPSGSSQVVRLAFAGHNDQPYQSVGRWLIDQGEIKPGEASWPAIREWARRNPARVPEMLAANPRLVFFREEPLPDPQLGPRGAQGVPLVPERSIAVDPKSVPYGSPVWLDTTEPLSARPLRRLVLAQDTGSAITGAVRADYFWGWGERAEQQAGRMKQPLRMWVLWPK